MAEHGRPSRPGKGSRRPAAGPPRGRPAGGQRGRPARPAPRTDVRPPKVRIPPLDGRERARVEELVRDVTDEEGFEILAYLLRPDRTLRLTLDRESRPVDISALTFLNHRIRGALEEAGLAVDDYAVELESPGVRRILATLRHFERFLGEFARVRWNEDKDEALGTQRVRIESVQGDAVHARRENGEPVQFTVAELHSARLDPDAEPKRSRE